MFRVRISVLVKERKENKMYVYIVSYGIFTVGFYRPDGEWVPESDHGTSEEAAGRAHYLNGGVDIESIMAESARLIADAISGCY
jgi:hypothetical protein